MRCIAALAVTVGVLGAITWTAASGAQVAEAPPPVEVPTVPVPQVLAPIPPPTGIASAAPKNRFGPAPLPSTTSTSRAATSASPTDRPPPSVATGTDSAATPSGAGAGTGGGAGSPSGAGSASGTPSRGRGELDGVFRVVGASGTPRAAAGTPTGKSARAHPNTHKTPGAVIAEWPGFRMLEDGSSEVMVEFSSVVAPPTEHHAAGTLTWVFRGVQVPRSNNRNPLLTQHFNTPVLNARLVPVKGELHLVVDLRSKVTVSTTSGSRSAAEGAGQQFFVRFPAGEYRPRDDAGEVTPRPHLGSKPPTASAVPSSLPAASGASPAGPLTGPHE